MIMAMNVDIKIVRCFNTNEHRAREEILVSIDDKVVATGSFGGEPEDNMELRDYSWVKGMVAIVARGLGAEVSIVEINAGDDGEFVQHAYPKTATEDA